MNEPFPTETVLVGLRDLLRWLIAYEPPPGPAVGGRVDVKIDDQQEDVKDG